MLTRQDEIIDLAVATIFNRNNMVHRCDRYVDNTFRGVNSDRIGDLDSILFRDFPDHDRWLRTPIAPPLSIVKEAG